MSDRPIINRPVNVAWVEQDSPSKVPVLHPGVISPVVMRKFQNGCLDYFDNKETANDKQVCKILPGIKDPRICDWINTDHAHVQALKFSDFMIEFCAAYLEEDWEEDTRRALLGMTQDNMSFWDYVFASQSKNSLLNGTGLKP
jgi:hypothetical protein